MTPSAEESAAPLIAALQRGEGQAVPTLVDRYEARIYNFASRMCRNAEDARDVLQETFLAAVRAGRTFRGESTLATWLFRIAANACRKLRRRGKFEPARHRSLEESRDDGRGPSR